MSHGDPKFYSMFDVRDLLEADEKLAEWVGDQIHPIIAPEGTVGDWIAYERGGIDTKSSKMQGFALFESFFFISVVSDNYRRSLDIAYRCYKVLEGHHPFGHVTMTGYAEDYLDQKFIQELKFSLT